MSRGTGRTSRLLAGLGLVALGALNLHVLTMPIDISAVTLPAGSDDAVPPLAAPTETAALGTSTSRPSYPQTLARPLFRPDRRPQDKAKPDATAARRQPPARTLEPPSGLELVGIIKEGRNDGRALIRSADAPVGTWVQVGHELQGWRLARIETRSILLEAGDRQLQLILDPPKE
jgi:hypothetical protein